MAIKRKRVNNKRIRKYLKFQKNNKVRNNNRSKKRKMGRNIIKIIKQNRKKGRRSMSSKIPRKP